jgi:hypothetical protein
MQNATACRSQWPSPKIDLNWWNEISSNYPIYIFGAKKWSKANWGFWKGKERYLATFANHHCIEGCDRIESDMIEENDTEKIEVNLKEKIIIIIIIMK